MSLFRTHREAARANNRVIALVFAGMGTLAVLFAVIVAVHYLLGWW